MVYNRKPIKYNPLEQLSMFWGFGDDSNAAGMDGNTSGETGTGAGANAEGGYNDNENGTNATNDGRDLNTDINPATEVEFDLDMNVKSITTNTFGELGIESRRDTSSSFDFDFDELTFTPYDKTKPTETFGSLGAHLYEAGFSMQAIQTIDTIKDIVSLYMTITGIPNSFAMIQAGKVFSVLGALKLASELEEIASTASKLQSRYGISTSDFEMEFDKNYGGDGDMEFAIQKSTEVLVEEAKANNTQLSDFLYGNLFDWMPGGVFYAAIYAGGDFFNAAGSLAQTRFVGEGDMNMNDELFLRMGVYGETPRKKLGSLAGDENFSILNFGG